MAKKVLVDGFNVIRRDPELSALERKNFYGAQEQLLSRLAQYRQGTSNRVTVVFDGTKSPNPYRHKSIRHGIGVIYSAQGETADDVITDLVSSATGEHSGYVVVTADRALADACRRQRVIVAPPETLMQRSRSPLMPQHADFLHGKHEEEGWVGHTRKKGNPRRPPKDRRKSKGLW